MILNNESNAECIIQDTYDSPNPSKVDPKSEIFLWLMKYISDLIDNADGERINRFGESIPKNKSNKLRNTLSTINKGA